VAGVQDLAELVEKPVDPVVGLVGVVVNDAERDALVIGHGVDNPGYFHHVALVMAGQGVELADNEQASHADRPVPAHLRVH
jgi:hypothetical protein